MLAFWFLCALGQCLLLTILLLCGRRLTQRAIEERKLYRYVPDGGWPKAAMIIPLAGTHPNMKKALQSLLDQDYPHLLPVMVTATGEEEAARLIDSLRRDHPEIRHVVAGQAQICGQKNHNILQGVAAVEGEVEIYVFCDSTHQADPDFARCLMGPVISGESAFSTGYHVVHPCDERPVTLAYALSVQLMRFLQALSMFTQPWGGAMCISRKAFRQYGIAKVWAENVVDDCSLGAYLQKRGAYVRLCAAALLRTDAADHGLSVWRTWMDRQVLFLKFCMPGQWVLLGVLAVLMSLPPLGAALLLGYGLLGVGSGTVTFLLLLWLTLLAGALGAWRSFFSRPIGLIRWLWAFVCAVAMFVFVYVQSIRTKEIIWKDFAYRVGKGGKIQAIRRL